ncbi:MAG: chromosomal replication initiator protein DnaA [Clostridia bacterium]|nr:chromosomal replication initiator protein DnaA [Clostridia bacterium]
MKDINEMLSDIKSELSLTLNAAEYMLWINGLTGVAYTTERIIVCAPSENSRRALEDNYAFKFLDACAAAGYPFKEVTFTTEKDAHLFTDETPPAPSAEEIAAAKNQRKNPFVERYTFENFVVGDSNRMAFSTAKNVAENPGVNPGFINMNPLYIYGGVGLGKTHLLHSIGNYLFENNPSVDVVYMPAHKLSNEYFSALSQLSSDSNALRKFEEKYSSVDVLILDDVQFLQKKGGLQDVFFKIFNDLYVKGKQIILASDRPPKEINDIEDRLRSRFEGGMMADIWTPSIDTRVNIIMKKLESIKVKLDDDVIFYIAEKVNTNIRELEGALSRIIMYSQLNGSRPTLSLAKEALKETEEKNDVVDSNRIIAAVSDYYHVPSADIIGKKKNKAIVEARMMAIYLVYDLLSLPLINIGQIFGGRDHTTIMYSRDKILSSLTGDGKNDKIIKDLKETLNVE